MAKTWRLQVSEMKSGISPERPEARTEICNPEGTGQFQEQDVACDELNQLMERKPGCAVEGFDSKQFDKAECDKGETNGAKGQTKVCPGGGTRGRGLEAGFNRESILRGVLSRQKPDKGTKKRGQCRRDAGWTSSGSTVDLDLESLDGNCG